MTRWLLWVLGATFATTAAAYEGDTQRGRTIYQQRCAVCHGQDGRGNDGMAVDFREEWHRLTKSDGELRRSLQQGLRTPGKSYKSGPMPPQPLTERDMRDVMTYLRRTFLN